MAQNINLPVNQKGLWCSSSLLGIHFRLLNMTLKGMLSIWNIIFHNPLRYSDHLSEVRVMGSDHSMLGKTLVEHTWLHKHRLRKVITAAKCYQQYTAVCAMTLFSIFLYIVNASLSVLACLIICVLCFGDQMILYKHLDLF